MRRVGFATAIFWSVVASSARAGVLFQSAALAPDPTGGTSLLSNQWLASRFELASPVQVTSVGGQLIYANGTLFAAIVPLNGPAGLPVGQAFGSTDVLAETTFTAPDTGAGVVEDYQTPLSVTLGPGEYGLVLGSGAFGATGTGAMPYASTLGNATFFQWYPPGGGWEQQNSVTARFVIDGTAVPEPAMAALLGGLVAAPLLRRRRR